MKHLFVIFVGAVIIAVGVFLWQKETAEAPAPSAPTPTSSSATMPTIVHPITHATAVLHFDDMVVYTDPTGGMEAFQNQPAADIIVVTDIHGDHFNTNTLMVVSGDAVLIVPQAVKDMLPDVLAKRAVVMKNGEKKTIDGIEIEATPMYNLPESATSRHTKGRGNGYVFEHKGLRVYVAGDTSGIPEMRALKNIDIALVPMNLPFTMSVEEAADAVLAFKPKQVYPYHYRGQDGLSDVQKFKQLVNEKNTNIEVVLLDWYPAQK